MKFGLAIAVSVLLPFASFGQSTKDQIKELQRDLGLMQDQLRTLQRTQDERFAAMTVLIQQSLDASNRASQAVAGMQGGLNQMLGEQAKTVGGTVANVGNKVDQMSDEFRNVKESINDMNSRMSRLDAKLQDVSNAVRTLAAQQAAPPPPAAGGGTPGAPGGGAPTGPPPSAQATYENAFRDYSGGKLDLAMQEFQEYLKWFKQSDLAPNAQYYVGDIYLRQGDADKAVKAFDAVLEEYSEGSKTPDAHYMKAKALFQSGQKTAAAQEYCEVIRLYPTNNLANNSKTQIRQMGYSTCGGSAPPPAKKKASRR